MTQPPNDDVDFDRLENEASKVFAVWELMGASASSTFEDMPPVAPGAPPVTQTLVDPLDASALGLVRPTEVGGWAPASPASAHPHAATMPAFAAAPFAPTPSPAHDEAPLRSAAPVMPAPVIPAPVIPAPVMQSRTPAIHASGSPFDPPAPLATVPRAADPFAASVPDPGVTAPMYAFDDAPATPRVSMGFWIGSVVCVLIAAVAGVAWLSWEPAPSAPTATIAAEDSRPLPLPGRSPSAAAAPSPPVIAAPTAVTPPSAAPVAPAPSALPSSPPVEAAEARPTARVTATPSRPRRRPARRRRLATSTRGGGFVSTNPY